MMFYHSCGFLLYAAYVKVVARGGTRGKQASLSLVQRVPLSRIFPLAWNFWKVEELLCSLFHRDKSTWTKLLSSFICLNLLYLIFKIFLLFFILLKPISYQRVDCISMMFGKNSKRF